MYSGRSPSSMSPLSKDGSSLDTRQVDCSQGVLTNVDDYLRPAKKAKLIRNFHQFSRGVFSSSGGGWKRDLQNGLNAGADIYDFGVYYDAKGGQFLLAQAGNTLYNYALGGTITFTGTRTTGDKINLTFALATGDYVFQYTVNTGTDSSNNALAANIQAAIALDATLAAEGVTATVLTNVVTLVLAKYISDPICVSRTAAGTADGTEIVTFQHIGVGTAITGMTALSVGVLPCIRPASPNSTTTKPFSIYCNGVIEPKKLSGSATDLPVDTVATLGFLGTNSTVVTVSGTVTKGATVRMFVFGTTLSSSPTVVSYTPVLNDTLVNVAAGLATAANNDSVLGSGNVVALSSGNKITFSYPAGSTFVFSSTVASETVKVTGSAAAGVLNLTITSTLIPTGSVLVTFTETTATNSDGAIGLAAAINASTAVQAGVTAYAFSNFVTIIYPSQNTVTFAQSTSGGPTLTLSAGVIETATITGTPVNTDLTHVVFTNAGITGTPVTVNYTQVTGDTITTVAAGLAGAINGTANIINAGISAVADGNVVWITAPASLGAVTYANTGTTGVTNTLAAGNSGNSVILTYTAGSNGTTFPGTFSGLTFSKPALCTPFQSRVAYAAFDPTTPASQNLLISALGNAEAFPLSAPSNATDAWTIPIPQICGRPTALRSFRRNTNQASEVLVVGCTNGMCVVSGTDATTFSLEIQSLGFGIPSNRCFAELDNTLLFMATDGFRTYSGENSNTNLITDSISLDIYNEFLNVDRKQWAKAHCIHHRDTQEIWFWVPYYGTAGLRKNAFIFNYNTLDGNPIWYFKDNTTCNASIEFNSTFYGGNNTGLVQKWYGVSNYDDGSAGGAAQNILPGAEIIFSLIGVGNPAQFCSINGVLISTSANDQKFLMNAAAFELMDDGSTRKQQQQPINFVVQSRTIPQTVLGPASPSAWTLNFSAFPQLNPKFLSDYVPEGHGRFWEFSINCNDSSHNCDVTGLQATISIGGKRV